MHLAWSDGQPRTTDGGGLGKVKLRRGIEEPVEEKAAEGEPGKPSCSAGHTDDLGCRSHTRCISAGTGKTLGPDETFLAAEFLASGSNLAKLRISGWLRSAAVCEAPAAARPPARAPSELPVALDPSPCYG